ncbi:IS66 family transposase [Noviherbaspirillum malthae]|uniref:IS66 family transposase n=1 Tax=Noviherbaspirillum malthae TaxID=1260987 RepID=UPI00188FCDA1|nr:IS66 family transposase [Noviherbaspirillum malthae]
MSQPPILPSVDADLIAAVQAQLAALQGQLHAVSGELKVVKVERDLLRERVAAFEHKLFAARSEARHADQRDLFFNEAELLDKGEVAPGEKISVPAHNRHKRGRKPLDPALEREVIRHELPASERTCPHDGTPLVEIGVETTEQLDIVPAKVRVIRHERVKYACPCCDGGMAIAPAPIKLIPRSLLTEKALAWIITAKYQDGLPLYRQAALIGPLGGHFCRNTLAANVVRAGMAVQPVINLMRDHLLDADLILGDETELQVLKEPGRAARTKSYLWAQMSGTGPPIRLFTYAPSRSAKTALALYDGARGALLTDGYESYAAVARAYNLVHLGCWAHARRAFIEAETAVPKASRSPEHLATQFIAAIGELYAVEAKWRDAEPARQTVEERWRLRQETSVPILERIKTLLLANLHAVVPGSLLGRALHYLSGQWPKLTRYIEDGRYPIDNNPCENAIRPFVVGRRNWLFSDTVAGAQASANLYSLIETAKANRLEPYRYLCELFARLPQAKTVDDIETLLPWKIVLPD